MTLLVGLVLLGIARLFPQHGFGLWLRLAAATLVLLAPGRLVARALGLRSWAAALTWSVALVAGGLALTFAVHASLTLTLVLVLAAGAAALATQFHPGRVRSTALRSPTTATRLNAAWAVAGIGLGVALWSIEGLVKGDALFHLGRVRKLDDFGSLSLRAVDEFKDGGLHPGYAFPLWHGFLALIAWFSGLDPEVVVRHAPSLLAPIACAVVWEAGVAVFGSRLAGASFLVATLTLFCFAPGHAGSFDVLTLPATSTRQIMVPAAIAIFFTARTRIGWATLAAIFGVISLSHPTYAIFLLIPLLALLRWEWRNWLIAAVPTGLVLLWLKPVVDQTISHNPKSGELMRGIVQYQEQLVIHGPRDFRIAPEVFGRSGAVQVAALILLPAVAFALPRRWAAFALGGTLIVMVLGTVPWLFVHFSDVVGLSQSRRAIGFAPLPFALVGAAALLVRRVWVVPAALVAGIVLQRLWPGDFEYGLKHGGPPAAAWWALVAGGVALVLALVLRRPPLREHWALGTAAVILFCVPAFIHGAWHWRATKQSDPTALSPRLIHSLRTKVPKGAIVIAPLATSYRVAAAAPVYIVGAPVTHVAATTANKPYERAKDIQHWVLTNDPAIPKKYGATWQIRGGRLARIP